LPKLRRLLEDFPKNHNLILFGQSGFNHTLQLRVNEDIRSRVTCSAKLTTLSNAGVAEFVYEQLDRVGLPHTVFSKAAVKLVARSSEGVLRCIKNLCVGGMIEAVRDQTRVVDTRQINAVLMQRKPVSNPVEAAAAGHWRGPRWRHSPPVPTVAAAGRAAFQFPGSSVASWPVVNAGSTSLANTSPR